MKITKMTAGMGRTIQGEKQFENYKPFTSIEVEVDENDDIQDVKRFISDHLRLWQAEVESDVHGRINQTPMGQWGKVNYPQAFGASQQQYPPLQPIPPHGPFPAQKVPHPPTAPVNGAPIPPAQPTKPDVAFVGQEDETVFEAEDPEIAFQSWEED